MKTEDIKDGFYNYNNTHTMYIRNGIIESHMDNSSKKLTLNFNSNVKNYSESIKHVESHIKAEHMQQCLDAKKIC